MKYSKWKVLNLGNSVNSNKKLQAHINNSKGLGAEDYARYALPTFGKTVKV